MKHFKLKYIATLIIFFSLAMNLSAQDVRISSSLEKDSIWLGDQIKLMLMA